MPSHKRTAIADRIEDTAMLPWVIDAGVSYPSDALAQALIGEFTEKAWACFKTATDIYCDCNRLEPKVDAWGRTGPRISLPDVLLRRDWTGVDLDVYKCSMLGSFCP